VLETFWGIQDMLIHLTKLSLVLYRVLCGHLLTTTFGLCWDRSRREILATKDCCEDRNLEANRRFVKQIDLFTGSLGECIAGLKFRVLVLHGQR
jgi:hypothetical protein